MKIESYTCPKCGTLWTGPLALLVWEKKECGLCGVEEGALKDVEAMYEWLSPRL